MADDIFWNSLPSKPMEKHWSKTGLKALGKKGKLLVLKSERKGTLAIKWENKDAVTKGNLTRILKGSENAVWHVQWFEAEDGTRFIIKILDEAQYSEYLKLRNQNRKIRKHGFETGDMWLT